MMIRINMFWIAIIGLASSASDSNSDELLHAFENLESVHCLAEGLNNERMKERYEEKRQIILQDIKNVVEAKIKTETFKGIKLWFTISDFERRNLNAKDDRALFGYIKEAIAEIDWNKPEEDQSERYHTCLHCLMPEFKEGDRVTTRYNDTSHATTTENATVLHDGRKFGDELTLKVDGTELTEGEGATLLSAHEDLKKDSSVIVIKIDGENVDCIYGYNTFITLPKSQLKPFNRVCNLDPSKAHEEVLDLSPRWAVLREHLPSRLIQMVMHLEGEFDIPWNWNANKYTQGEKVKAHWRRNDRTRSTQTALGLILKVHRDGPYLDIIFVDGIIQTKIPISYISERNVEDVVEPKPEEPVHPMPPIDNDKIVDLPDQDGWKLNDVDLELTEGMQVWDTCTSFSGLVTVQKVGAAHCEVMCKDPVTAETKIITVARDQLRQLRSVKGCLPTSRNEEPSWNVKDGEIQFVKNACLENTPHKFTKEYRAQYGDDDLVFWGFETNISGKPIPVVRWVLKERTNRTTGENYDYEFPFVRIDG